MLSRLPPRTRVKLPKPLEHFQEVWPSLNLWRYFRWPRVTVKGFLDPNCYGATLKPKVNPIRGSLRPVGGFPANWPTQDLLL